MRQRTTRLMTLFSEAKQTNQSAIRPAEPSTTRHTIHPLAMHAFATAPPPFADPLSTLALPLHGPFVYVLVHSILHRRTGYAVPAFTNSLLAAWCTAPIRSDPHRTHPIESDLTGPDRMGPQPTSVGMLVLRGRLPILTPTPTNRRHDDQNVRERPRPRTMRQNTPHNS